MRAKEHVRFCLHMLRGFEEEAKEEDEESVEGWEEWQDKRLYSFRDRFVKKILWKFWMCSKLRTERSEK